MGEQTRTPAQGQAQSKDYAHQDSALGADVHRLLARLEGGLANLRERFGADAIRVLDDSPVAFDYPVLEYPTKVASHNLDKTPRVSGTLLGLKGQYLILDSGVINLRKYTGYEVKVSA
jgi:hypothetical protein